MSTLLQQQRPLSERYSKPSLPRHATSRLSWPDLTAPVVTGVLTVLSLAVALIYVNGHARVARNEYQRQEALRQVAALRARRAKLQLQLSAALAPERIAAAAAEAGLRRADPATETHFVFLKNSETSSEIVSAAVAGPPGVGLHLRHAAFAITQALKDRVFHSGRAEANPDSDERPLHPVSGAR